MWYRGVGLNQLLQLPRRPAGAAPSRRSVDVVTVLLKAHPEGAKTKNRNGRRRTQLLQLSRRPAGAAKTKNRNGRLPLPRAAVSRAHASKPYTDSEALGKLAVK